MSNFFNEPQQQPNSQHILTDERSKAWVEVPDAKADRYPALASSSITWVAVSALVYKLVRSLSFALPLVPIVLSVCLLLLPVTFVLYKRSQDDGQRFSTLVYITLVVLGLVIGGL